MKVLRIRIMSLLALLLIASGGYLIGCGDDEAEGNANQETTGDDEESSFDVTIEDESGESETASGKHSNEEASEDTWGASINNGLLRPC